MCEGSTDVSAVTGRGCVARSAASALLPDNARQCNDSCAYFLVGACFSALMKSWL